MAVREIKEYTCDCCGKLLAKRPDQSLYLSPNDGCVRILWLYCRELSVSEGESMLCDACKINALDRAKKVLEAKKEPV